MGLGIAFEGAASRAAFHIGVAEGLRDLGIRIDAAGGASSGAMVAAALATGRLDRLRDAWRALAGQSFFDRGRILRRRWPIRANELVGGVVREVLGDLSMGDADTPLVIVVTQLSRRGWQERAITRSDDVPMADAVMASCFFPGLYHRPTFLDGRPTVDGAWRQRVPVDAVGALGADRVLAVITKPDGRLRAGLRGRRDARPTTPHWIVAPDEDLPIRAWDLDRTRADASIGAGIAAAEHLARTHFGRGTTGT